MPVPTDGQAQGSEGLRADRQERAAQGLARQVQRHRAVHRGREAPRHADRGGRASAEVRRAREEHRFARPSPPCRASVTWSKFRAASPCWRRASGSRKKAATRSRSRGTSRMRSTCPQPVSSPITRRWPRPRARSPAATATPPRQWPAARKRSRRRTSFRTSRMRRWSRSIASSSWRRTAAKCGTASSSRRATRTRWPKSSG